MIPVDDSPEMSGTPRTLSFPDDRSFGVIYLRQHGDERGDVDADWASWEVNGWQEAAPARGDVLIPSGFDAGLEVALNEKDLSPLSQLPANALAILSLTESAPRSEQLVHVAELTGMRRLEIGSGWLRNDDLAHLSNLTNLRALDLWGCDR